MLFVSCAKDITIDQPAYKRQIVVDGYIETGRAAYIHLTYSSPFVTNYDSISILNSFLNHAKITINSSDGESEIFSLRREKDFFPPFVYRSRNIIGKEGVSYDIVVEADGKIITATTSIPKSVKNIDAVFELTSDTTGFLKFKINESVESKMFLFPRVKSLKAEENFHASFHGVYEQKSENSDEIWHSVYRVEENRFLSLLGESSIYRSYPKYQYDINDTILMMVGTVDETSYKVLKSLYFDLSQTENPFAFNGSKVESNINDGIGRWTGIGVASLDTLVLKKLIKF